MDRRGVLKAFGIGGLGFILGDRETFAGLVHSEAVRVAQSKEQPEPLNESIVFDYDLSGDRIIDDLFKAHFGYPKYDKFDQGAIGVVVGDQLRIDHTIKFGQESKTIFASLMLLVLVQ